MSHKNPQKQASSTDCQKQKRKSQMTNRRQNKRIPQSKKMLNQNNVSTKYPGNL